MVGHDSRWELYHEIQLLSKARRITQIQAHYCIVTFVSL